MSTPVLLVVTAIYVTAFWTIAISSSRWALLLIFALTPFQNDVSGGGPLKFSIAEVNMLLCVPVMLIKARHLRFGPMLLPACIYIGVCAFSALGQWRDSTLQSIVQVGLFTVMLVVVFASLARSVEDYRFALNGLIVVSVFLACSILASGSSYIYGLHKNGVGASLASTFVIAIELWLSAQTRKARFYYLATMAIMGVGCLITVSRGAWMAAIVGTLVILGIRGRVGLVFKCSMLLVPMLAIGWRFLPETSREYATGFGQERTNIRARYESADYALRLFEANPIQGAGMGLRKDYDATNIVLLCLAETGLPGLLAFLGLNLAVVVMVLKNYRRAPPDSLSASVLALALALILGKLLHGLVDHYWSRGSLSAAWATVGMATFVITEERRQRRHLAKVLAMQAYEEQLALEQQATEAASLTHSAERG